MTTRFRRHFHFTQTHTCHNTHYMTCVFVLVGPCSSIGFRIPPPRYLIVHSQTQPDLSFPHKMLAFTVSGAQWNDKSISCRAFLGRFWWVYKNSLDFWYASTYYYSANKNDLTVKYGIRKWPKKLSNSLRFQRVLCPLWWFTKYM